MKIISTDKQGDDSQITKVEMLRNWFKDIYDKSDFVSQHVQTIFESTHVSYI